MKSLMLVLVLTAVVCVSHGQKSHSRRETKLTKRNKFLPKQHLEEYCVENVCNGTDNYPAKYISKLLMKSKGYQGYNGTVIELVENIGIQSRINYDVEKNMCTTRETLMYPRKAMNLDMQWKFIVQDEQYMRQAVHFEACSQKAKCFADSFIPNDYKTYCKTKRIAIRLLALTENGQINIDYFQMPAGCVCSYKTMKVTNKEYKNYNY
ncbi:PREDICTED: uncharacterized protein LOC108559407 [Nicrophorus vespilloides]|uniref:Uncharacterized protein LOC108559407 n=1 Tax=Nicrophorus vespilloides TaxID=110193 RepID=A0ABM1MC67_NICVS|nr:PREDICTED: uncharacterized protein LOC108559407 [Nicrophorus vespilloides]